MDKPANREFGKRRPVVARPGPQPPVKRSGHVALLLMGTLAVGGGAYALMPSENCRPSSPGMAGPAIPQVNGECPPRGYSSGGSGGGGSGGGSRSNFFSSDSASSHASSGASDAGSAGVTRGGFGAFAHSFGSHFSFGG
jgi:hypothetical protein